MSQPGFVHILTNPSISGCVKIGKTTRDPVARAAELSVATGVPTPFTVAYDAYFADCDRAEKYVHSHLDQKGVRLASNREFFQVSLRDAVGAVNAAEKALGCASTPAEEATVHVPSRNDESDATETPAWRSLLDEAECYDLGFGDVIQDQEHALTLYKQAAALGAPEAYVRLAEMTVSGEGCTPDPRLGLSWLKRGASHGSLRCLCEMAEVFAGVNPYFDLPIHEENARKCWRQFFSAPDNRIFQLDSDLLLRQVKVFRLFLLNRPGSAEDDRTLRGFAERFICWLSTHSLDEDSNQIIGEIRALMNRNPRHDI